MALGHDLGLIGDVIAGVLGAFLGGVLAMIFKVNFSVAGHPIISEIVIAFIGAVILLFVLRIFGLGRGK